MELFASNHSSHAAEGYHRFLFFYQETCEEMRREILALAATAG